LIPLGGLAFGYKGAALAAVSEILSAVFTGMPHCSRLIPMIGTDMSTPRTLGHFFIVIDPRRFVRKETYDAGMRAYLDDIRSQPSRPKKRVIAPGDREWATERERRERGIPVNETLERQFNELADRVGIPPLR
jgi:LDH2 family malate/lactate/ureidoglycolate dehydrogenase